MQKRSKKNVETVRCQDHVKSIKIPIVDHIFWDSKLF